MDIHLRKFSSLLDSDIPENKFISVMKLPYDEIKQKIKLWVDEGKIKSLAIHFDHIVVRTDFDYIILLKSLFYFGFLVKAWPVAFDYIQNLIHKIANENKKEIIRSVFFENGISEFVANYIQYTINHRNQNWDYIFSLDECRDINFEMFKLVCIKDGKVDEIYKFLQYTSYTRYTKNSSNNNYESEEVRNEKAYEYFISYIESNYTTVLPLLIDKDFNNYAYLSPPAVDDIWKSKDAFKSFIDELIESNKEDKMLKEFGEFVIEYFNKDAPIQFDFKYINK